jgi:hypothetical protein
MESRAFSPTAVASDGATARRVAQVARSGTATLTTCFAVGAVLGVCEVFRFLLEHQSLGVTLVLLLVVRAGSVISRRVLLDGREKQKRSQSSRWKCR